VVALVGVVFAVLVLAGILEQIGLALLLGHADEHLAVGHLTVLEETLEGIERCGLLALRVLHQFEGGDVALALGNVDIEAVALEPEQQFTAQREVLSVEVCGLRTVGAAQHQK